MQKDKKGFSLLSLLQLFPCHYQGDDTRVAFPAFRNVVALEVKVEDIVLYTTECFASLAEPVVAVVLGQFYDLWANIVYQLSALLSPNRLKTLLRTCGRMW